MRKILLVDDEMFIRNGLRALIERSDSAFKDIYECDNGRSALEMLQNQRFDLAIVDMRMPFMDGITLIEKAQQLPDKPAFIILSGYDDFKYAKEALKYGVKDYLLKPVDRVEFIEALLKVEKELESLEQAVKEKDEVDDLMEQFSSNELNYILINTNLQTEEIRKVLDAVKIDIFDGMYGFAVVYVDKSRPGIANDSQFPANELFREYFNRLHRKFFGFNDIKGNYFFAFEGEIIAPDLMKFLVDKHLDEFFIGLSRPGKGIEEIHQKYGEANEILKYRLLSDSRSVLEYSQVCERSRDFKVPEEDIQRIAEMVGTNKLDELSRALNLLFDSGKLRGNSIGYLEKLTESIGTLILQRFSKLIPYEAVDLQSEKNELLKDVYNFKSLNEYFFELKNHLVLVNDYLFELNKEFKEKSSIRSAVQWIQENYHREDLTMTMVANYVSLNYTYFSLAFKEFTGMSFVNYLKKVRIDKAKELIRGTDMKIQEISQKVGFQSPRHFAKTFKEEVGISPLDYSRKVI